MRVLPFLAIGCMSMVQCNCNRDAGASDAAAPKDGGGDRGPITDSSIDVDLDSASDGGVACAAPDADVHDFAGYTRVVSLDPCCRIDVPTSLASLPPLQWEACKTGRLACQEFKVTWTNPDSPRLFAYARAWPSSHNTPTFEVAIWRGAEDVEDIVYDLNSSTPLKSWRTDRTGSDCVANSASNSDRVLPIAMTVSAPFRLGNEARDAGSTVTSVFQTLGPPTIFPTEAIQSYDLSDELLALSASPAGAIVVGPPSGPFVRASSPTQFMRKPMVAGSLVLALAEKGNGGYAQIDKVGTDGAVTTFLASPATHVSGAASDGVDLFWIEGSGGTTPLDPPTKCELWSAPLGPLPPTLPSRKKLATLSTCGSVTETFAAGGYVAVRESPKLIGVVRTSDGALRTVANSANREFGGIANLTGTDVWVAERGPKGDEIYLSVVRLTYAIW